MAVAQPSAASTRRSFGGRRFRHRLWPYLLIAPAIIATVASTYGPLISNAFVSLTAYNLRLPASKDKYVGLQNYESLFATPKIWQVVGQTLVYTFTTALLGVVIAMFAAAILRPPLRGRRLRGRTVVFSLFLLPWVTPPVVSAFIWSYLYDIYGPINGSLQTAGLIDKPIQFLNDTVTAVGPFSVPMLALIQVGVWVSFPFLFVFTDAAMSSIPRDLYEAAELEGAGSWGSFRYITLPLIAPVVEAALFLLIVIRFGTADLPLLLTNGAPLDKTNILGVFLYQTAFGQLQIGKAAAIGMLLLATTIPFAVLYIRRSQRQIRSL